MGRPFYLFDSKSLIRFPKFHTPSPSLAMAGEGATGATQYEAGLEVFDSGRSDCSGGVVRKPQILSAAL